MRADAELIGNNCLKFNHDNDEYLGYGRKWLEAVERVFAEADAAVQAHGKGRYAKRGSAAGGGGSGGGAAH